MCHSWCSAMSLRVVGEFLQHIPQESNVGARSHIGDKRLGHSPSHNIAFSACDNCHMPLMLGLIVLAALRPSEAYEEHKGDFQELVTDDKNQTSELCLSGAATRNVLDKRRCPSATPTRRQINSWQYSGRASLEEIQSISVNSTLLERYRGATNSVSPSCQHT
jgi:hypothetical protein